MIRKIFDFFPKGLQERIKLLYYNMKVKNFSFSKKGDIYQTTMPGKWSIFTKSPLYFIVKDVERYEKYYKVSAGNVVIDAGANAGILTLIYSKKVKTPGTVYAFEPDVKNINSLNYNLALNENVENIHLVEKGLWNKKQVIEFYEAGNVGSSIFYEGNTSTKREIQVLSIDAFLAQENIQRLDFIKMDIEGAEIQALDGAVKTIRKFNPNFAIASYHIIDNEYTYKKVEAFFSSLKYPFKTIFYEDGEILTYAGPAVKNLS